MSVCGCVCVCVCVHVCVSAHVACMHVGHVAQFDCFRVHDLCCVLGHAWQSFGRLPMWCFGMVFWDDVCMEFHEIRARALRSCEKLCSLLPTTSGFSALMLHSVKRISVRMSRACVWPRCSVRLLSC